MRDEDDVVLGFFCACTEITEVVMANRRAFRLNLGEATRGPQGTEAIMDAAVAALGDTWAAPRSWPMTARWCCPRATPTASCR